MYNFDELKLSKLCTDIDNHGITTVMVNLTSRFEYSDFRKGLYAFYSLYQYCQKYYINIDEIFNDKDLQSFYCLLKSGDIINLELAKQLLIIKIRECTISNQKHS